MASTVHDVVPFEGCFPSWEAFDVARKSHGEKTYTMYVCRNTVKVAVANKRRKMQVPEAWVYDRKIYVCTHGYKRVSRSSGSRPRQNVRYSECNARFTACVVSEVFEEGRKAFFVKVIGQHLVHTDHPVNLEQWQMYSQNRAAVIEHPYLTHEVELMRRVGSNKRAARDHIETLTGKICTMKDMHNLYARLKKREKNSRPVDAVRSQPQRTTTGISSDLGGLQSATYAPNVSANGARVESVLQKFVDADVENHVSILSGDDGSNESICLASRAMKEHFQVFPELMILDVSMVTPANLQAGQQLHGFLVMDALGNAKPAFLARSTAMSPPLLHRVCQDFKRTHPKWKHIKVLVMNKLLPDVIQVLAREFPGTLVLLCQYHVLQLLNELLARSQAPVSIQTAGSRAAIADAAEEKIIDALQQLVFAHSELRYIEAKVLLTRQLVAGGRKEQLAIFDRVWEPYRACWTSYARTEHFDFASFFTKGVNSFWEPMKDMFKRAGDDTTAEVLDLPLRSVANNGVASNTISLIRDGDRKRCSSVNTLVQCTSEVLRVLKFVEGEWTSKLSMLELTKPVAVDRRDALLHLMVNCLSSFVVDLISSQLTAQSARASGSVAVTKTRAPKSYHSRSRSEDNEVAVVASAEATVRWLNKATREKHILQRDGSACDCKFFALYHLPCRHLIWYEVVSLQHKQLSLVAVGPRWFLRSFQVPKLNSLRESNEIEYHLL